MITSCLAGLKLDLFSTQSNMVNHDNPWRMFIWTFSHFTCNNADTKLPLLIAPILTCVCGIFDGEVTMGIHEELVGKLVKTCGHFDFMMRRGNKAVCVILAKKNRVEQGMIRCMIGSEVAAEVLDHDVEVVYGIVTDYFMWVFLRNHDSKFEFEGCSMGMTPNA
mmetsp:Transcript_12066/g.22584  ORF Transcript_12066/g.22584 Transcript_12066/m.22584 type:complete len:164 (+) Transcript_12066:90-581(+)